MTDRPPTSSGVRSADPFERVLLWREHGVWTRGAQAMLIAVLAFCATNDNRVAVWLAATIIMGAIDSRLSACVQRRPHPPVATALICVSQALSSISFSAIALVLISRGSPIHLAEAMLVLCATCLNNAMMTRGSRIAMASLVGPPAALLVAAPMVAQAFGQRLEVINALTMVLAGGAFTGFILRLAAHFNAEAHTLNTALSDLADHSARAISASEDALASRQRWRMIFDHSPLARMCFNATALHALLSAGHPAPEGRLGDLLRARLSNVADFFDHISLVEANQVASELCGDRLATAHFTEGFMDTFAEALNAIGDDGVLPAFPAELIRADGSLLEVEVHLRMAPCPSLPWSLCLATYVDMSGIRRAAREHQEAREAAEIASRAKTDFLAVISHEIRTPLNGVLGMAQAMANNPLSAAQKRRLGVIDQSGSALLEIVNDLLDLSRFESGQVDIAEADFDLQATVRAVHGAHSCEAARAGLEFRLEIDPTLAALYRGDASRIRQILSALTSNALKFTPRGEVRLTVERSRGGVRFTVCDTGIGIAQDRQQRMFDKFAKADSSMTRRHGGAGLGLAICQQLCLAMGGLISVSSAPGAGSVFTLDLPLRPTAPDQAAAPGALGSRPLRILAAEDNPVNQLVLRALLDQLGLEPTVVENGLEAVRAWDREDWDLILMDVQMPVMDGQTAAMTIRAREAQLARTPTPIIAVTANAMTHQVAAYRGAGMDAVVSKPINVEELFSAMIEAVCEAPQVTVAKG